MAFELHHDVAHGIKAYRHGQILLIHVEIIGEAVERVVAAAVAVITVYVVLIVIGTKLHPVGEAIGRATYHESPRLFSLEGAKLQSKSKSSKPYSAFSVRLFRTYSTEKNCRWKGLIVRVVGAAGLPKVVDHSVDSPVTATRRPSTGGCHSRP